jgi:DNA-binding transcriptional MerR regulator
MERITVTKLSHISGLCVRTLQRYADAGKLPCYRDVNNWRVFAPEAVGIARQLAGIEKQEPATEDTARVG